MAPSPPTPPKIQIVPSAWVVAAAVRAARAVVIGCQSACASVVVGGLPATLRVALPPCDFTNTTPPITNSTTATTAPAIIAIVLRSHFFFAFFAGADQSGGGPGRSHSRAVAFGPPGPLGGLTIDARLGGAPPAP